ncbi:MAG: tRNA pseudouridine(13) synthase TruD [Thaumarchaeota archaeon]|nr:tRNA pseudouridine(13) synthase TruD [Nitrososphaerota archaeon]MBT5842940.1 tRNA pseudouridine(13) synthase TruD [Nitrososphaerota archaeon]MBT6469093.1 tRNA pseudouridine(13) synthase TruD [Nitrososphaerota archaeon]
MIPDLDSQIGISVYSTDFNGIGGVIRVTPEDFLVSEMISEKSQNSIKENDGYAVYKLKKKKIDTNHALSDIFRKKGIRLKSLGLKDASAITEQFVCSEHKGRVIDNFTSEKYSLEKIGFVKKPLTKKNMIGNHFKINISQCSDGLSLFEEHEKILNFYGYQRFGSKRPVTHLIGRAILRRDFAKAVDLILSFTSSYDSAENTEIREKLADKENYAKYYDSVPFQMDIERIVLKEMIDHDDPLKAIRAIPVSLRRFYVQAYQSFIFNQSLSAAFSDGEDLFEAKSGDVCFDLKGIIGKYVKGLDQNLALPFVGYSYYKKTRFDYQISKVLETEEITPKDFFIKEMQEVSSEGGFRQAAIRCSNYSTHENVVEFSLSRGSFATILLREIMKPQDPILAGF